MALIGFIGLGHMGTPMCKNLIDKGHQVRAFDLDADKLQEASNNGAEIGKNALDVAKGADFILSILPEGRHVRAVYLDEGGLLGKLQGSEFILECSTIDIETSRDLSFKAHQFGHGIVDAPVSGGVGGATAATLTFMIGGSETEFKKAQAILACLGTHFFHCGIHGNGQLTKICNNMMLAAHMVITSEAFVLAEKLGLSKEKLFEVASVSSGQSWSLTSYAPVPNVVPSSPANRDYKAGFSAAMMNKDLGLAMKGAEMASLTLAMGKKAKEIYQAFCDEGKSELDFSGIIKNVK